MTAAAPSGVVTFLFTDIEGSTRRGGTECTRDVGAERISATSCYFRLTVTPGESGEAWSKSRY
jgi:hypothetical protein